MEEKSVLSYWFQREEEGCSENLFHSRVKLQDRACALTIDHMSLINAASLEMVEKLDLPTTPHPQPYMLRLGNNELTIINQTLVKCLLGPLSYEVLCDVIPLHMVPCHLLMGRPWNKEHGAVYSLDNNHNCSLYTVTCGTKEYNLRSMDNIIYKAWREESLQKKEAEAQIIEQEEAKKRETAAAALSHEPIQFNVMVAFETDLKPRSVSPEERDDDTAVSTDTSVVVALYSHVDGMKCKDMLDFASAYLPYQTWRLIFNLVCEGSIGTHACVRGIEVWPYFLSFGDKRRREQCGYYFCWGRPPDETQVCVRVPSPKDQLSLCAMGWGPPATKRTREGHEELEVYATR